MRDIAVHKTNYDARLAAGENYVAAIAGTPAGSHARRVHRCVGWGFTLIIGLGIDRYHNVRHFFFARTNIVLDWVRRLQY